MDKNKSKEKKQVENKASVTKSPVASGPLVVSKINPRYFTVASGNTSEKKIVYLTGSHINNNFQDGMGTGKNCAENPGQFDYEAYLEVLKEHGLNFIRLWRWEQFKGYLPGADVHFCMTPQPWPRTGTGKAKDGKPKFDLSKFDEVYFDRLRNRIIAAGNKGIYVSAMLFEGFSLHLTATPDNIEGHPFHAANNINNIGITSIIDYQVLPLDPQVQVLQEAYIRNFIDVVHDLPNVLYEVANESSGVAAKSVSRPDGSTINTPIGNSTEWQYWVINFVKQYEQKMGYDKHPIGMTFQYPVAKQSKANDPLWNSPADWISPGFDDGPAPTNSRWRIDPPANDGQKVVIADTDHFSPMECDALWAWKSFLRGHNPILFDLGIVSGAKPADPSKGKPSYNSLEPARYAMGETSRYAFKMTLVDMKPTANLSSTRYLLANPGKEYLVLDSNKSNDVFTLMIEAGIYETEWFSVNSRKMLKVENLKVESLAKISFKSPFKPAGPAVLYLKKVEN